LTILGILLASVLVLSAASWAQEVITNRTGVIKITHPDGTTLTVKKDEPLPVILSGSTIEILEGSADIAPGEGFVKVIVAHSIALIEAGNKVTASLEPGTGKANFLVGLGEIDIKTGNTIVKLKTGQEVKIGLTKTSGMAEIKSIRGNIETVTVGVKVLVPQDAVAKISADPKTRKVHIVSGAGELQITSIDGRVSRVAKDGSVETEGAVEGEIQTFGEGIETAIVSEEPAEPERPEASPHRP